jgi:3-oxoacyl-[acyl-carrier-protein] synthase-3
MHTQILSLGHYLPERVVTNRELARQINMPEEWISRTTGVLERRRVSGETTSHMAAYAVNQALQRVGGCIESIDVLISACAGRQQTIPCTAAFIHRELQLKPAALVFDVDATCLGFLVALTVAGSLLEQGIHRQVAIASSELSSGTIDYGQPESAVLFGDAAAAALIGRAPEGEASRIVLSRFSTFSEGVELAQVRGAGTLHHPNSEGTTPEMNLFQMRGPEIFKLATKHMKTFLDQFFDQLPWNRGELDVVVPHQASQMALRQLTKRYGFRDEQVVSNLPIRGNCVAASIPLLLSETVEQRRIGRGDRVLLLGTGAGLTLGAVALVF